MNFRQQVTSALAWAGLVIVIAVPCAEVISSKLLSASSPAAPAAAVPQAKVVVAKPQPAPVAKVVIVAPPTDTERANVAPAPVIKPKPVIAMPPVVQAKVETKPAPTMVAEQPAAPSAPAPAPAPQPAAAATGDGNVVQDYLATNKKLPSYITASPKPAADPAPMTPAAQQLASTLSGTDSNGAPAAAAPSGSSIAIPAGTAGQAASSDDGFSSIDSTASAPAPVPMPVSSRPKGQPEQTVTEADLKDWKSGTLEDYLKSRGLLSTPSADQGDGN